METNYSSRPTLFPGKRNEEDVERNSLLIRQLRKKEIRENTSCWNEEYSGNADLMKTGKLVK